MESQPQNPEFRNNPENFHPWISTKILFRPIYIQKPHYTTASLHISLVLYK